MLPIPHHALTSVSYLPSRSQLSSCIYRCANLARLQPFNNFSKISLFCQSSFLSITDGWLSLILGPLTTWSLTNHAHQLHIDPQSFSQNGQQLLRSCAWLRHCIFFPERQMYPGPQRPPRPGPGSSALQPPHPYHPAAGLWLHWHMQVRVRINMVMG